MVMPKLTIEETRFLAESKGGQCLSKEYVHAKSKLKWSCSSGHEFVATPNAVKNQGAWCPVCGLQRMRRSLTKGPKHVLEIISEEYPEFPRKDPSQDRRRKLSEEQIGELQHLRKMGDSLVAIAKKFGVSHTTIIYHTNPKAKKRRNKLTYIAIKERMARDSDFREKMKLARAKCVEERLKEPGFRRYYNKVRNIRSKYNYYLKRRRIPSDNSPSSSAGRAPGC